MIWKKSAYGGGAIFGGGGKVNIESWRCAHTLRGHGGDVLDLAWSPNDGLLATASVDNTVIVWNGERLPEVRGMKYIQFEFCLFCLLIQALTIRTCLAILFMYYLYLLILPCQ